MNNAPILIVDDDDDDREFLREAWEHLDYDHELLFFDNAPGVLSYLRENNRSPFIILCDVNIPGMDGFELLATIQRDPYLKYKSIPFIFWSTSVSKKQIQKAYDTGVNGFFLKPSSYDEIKNNLIDIVKYWKKSLVPE